MEIYESARSEIEDYYISTLGPVLCCFFQELIDACSASKKSNVIFVSREGRFLADAFNAFVKDSEYEVFARNVHASRSFLARMLLPESIGLVVAKRRYCATFENLLIDKFGIYAADDPRSSWTQNELRSEFELPRDGMRLGSFMRRYVEINRESIKDESLAYRNYLYSCGFGESISLVSDVGYSGSIQQLLSILFNKPLGGYYLVTTTDSHEDVTGLGNVIGALFDRVAHFGSGEPLLDSSLILEALLSAPYGQFEGIVQTAEDDFDFSFGPSGRSQSCHAVLAWGQEALRNWIGSQAQTYRSVVDRHEFKKLAQELLRSTMRHRNRTPKLIQEIGDVDDRISGLGFITPWTFLPPLA